MFLRGLFGSQSHTHNVKRYKRPVSTWEKALPRPRLCRLNVERLEERLPPGDLLFGLLILPSLGLSGGTRNLTTPTNSSTIDRSSSTFGSDQVSPVALLSPSSPGAVQSASASSAPSAN